MNAGQPESPPELRAALGDWTMSLLRSANDATLHAVARLDGRIDEARLARAMRLLLDAEPLLGCRFVPGPVRPRWVRRDDLDGLRLCAVEPGPPAADAWGAWLADAVDPTREPLVTLTVLRGETDTLRLRVSHLVADAAGVRDCLELLAGIDRRLARDPGWVPTPAEGSRSLRVVSERFGVGDKLRMLRRGVRDLRSRRQPARWWSVPSTPGVRGPSAGGATYELRRIGAAQLRAMRSYGRARGATLNDLVTAAYLKGLAELVRPAADVPLRLRSTVDLRRYLPGRRAARISNLSAFAFLNVGPGPDRGFDELAEAVRREMTALKSDWIGLGEPALYGPLMSLLPYGLLDRAVRAQERAPRPPAEELNTPTLTNVGPFDPSRLGFGGRGVTDAYLIAPVMYPPGFAIAVSGFGESLTLSAGFCTAGVERAWVRELFERMVRALPGSDG